MRQLNVVVIIVTIIIVATFIYDVAVNITISAIIVLLSSLLFS
jgi:hypothetical protein